MPHHDTAEALDVLTALLEYFDDGRRWTKNVLADEDTGQRCLLGALDYLRTNLGINADAASHYLCKSLAPYMPPDFEASEGALMIYNDDGRDYFDV